MFGASSHQVRYNSIETRCWNLCIFRYINNADELHQFLFTASLGYSFSLVAIDKWNMYYKYFEFLSGCNPIVMGWMLLNETKPSQYWGASIFLTFLRMVASPLHVFGNWNGQSVIGSTMYLPSEVGLRGSIHSCRRFCSFPVCNALPLWESNSGQFYTPAIGSLYGLFLCCW